MTVAPRLDHLNIVVADMAASVRFYQSLFDMAVVLDCELRGPWFEAVTGLPGAVAHCVILRADPSGQDGFRIELLRYREPANVAAPLTRALNTEGLRHFAVRVDDIDACLVRARDLGSAFGVEPVQVPFAILPAGKRMVYLRDPDGVVVELAEYGARRAAGVS